MLIVFGKYKINFGYVLQLFQCYCVNKDLYNFFVYLDNMIWINKKF